MVYAMDKKNIYNISNMRGHHNQRKYFLLKS